MLPLDKKGKPLMPAILWCDSRSKGECKIVKEKIGERRVFDISGNGINPYFGGNKILLAKKESSRSLCANLESLSIPWISYF
jgi:xylulokinase